MKSSVFKIGDKVRLLNEPGEGIVTGFHNDLVMVELEEFEFGYPEHELLKIGADNEVIRADTMLKHEYENSEETQHQESDLKTLHQAFMQRLNERGVPEVDLHLHELIDDYAGMSVHERKVFQLEHAEKVVKAAVHYKVPRLVLIHGVGTRALKDELRIMLSRYQNIRCEDASFRLYGYGATELFIRIN
jgi:hypothetical protein